MVTSRNLYVLSPIIEKGEVFSYYCIVSLEGLDCNWMLIRDDEMLCHGVCAKNDIGLMLDSLSTDLSLSGGTQEWEPETIH